MLLLSIGNHSLGRPADLTQPDFRTASWPRSIRLPAITSVSRSDWTTNIPLLVLQGDADVWTPAAPCQAFIGGAAARGASVWMQIYPGAYHAFDSPNLLESANAARISRELGRCRADRRDRPAVARADALQRVPDFLARYLTDYNSSGLCL